jgi:anti-anti-sigma factor
VYDRGLLADEDAPFARLRLGGELDFARKTELTALLAPLVAEETAIIDLRSVRFLDSSALACFVVLRRAMVAAHGSARIVIAGLRPELLRVFEVAGLADAFEMRTGAEIGPAP